MGRMDDYAVGLQVGSLHIVKIKLDQLLKDLELDLPNGDYRVFAQFTGTGPLHKNTDRVWALWHFWEGVAKSNVIDLQLSE